MESFPTEVDALILENSLIKRYHRASTFANATKPTRTSRSIGRTTSPKYRSTPQRFCGRPGYYGPYTFSFTVRETLDNLRRVFPYLTCNREITGKEKDEACLFVL